MALSINFYKPNRGEETRRENVKKIKNKIKEVGEYKRKF